MAQLNQIYKDRLFIFIFGREENKEWTLSLYNAVNGSHYSDASAIEITTIEEVIYLGMHNDVSFVIADELNLYEQQSSYNPNMPLRQLQYLGLLYEGYLKKHKDEYDKYGKILIPLPAPRFVVFYNGLDKCDEETVLHLSDAFPKGMKGDVEVSVRMLNINYGKNKALLDACKPLMEYAWIIKEIRRNAKNMDIKDAVDSVIDNLPGDFQLKPFLDLHKAEVGTMLLTEYNEIEREEFLLNSGRKEGMEKGRKEGMEKGRKEGMEKGRKEGMEKGRKEGMEKGRKEGIVSAAKNMMETLKMSFEQVAEILKIPTDEYENYRKALKIQ